MTTLFRCGETEHRITPTYRDVCLLEGRYFFHNGGYRELFGLNFVRGLGAPPTGKVLQTFSRSTLAMRLRGLLLSLEDHQDLLIYNYQYGFDARPGRGSGGQSGFRIDGLTGSIRVSPGYCDLTLSEAAPNGRGRVAQIVDMRVKRKIMTDDLGMLRVYRRKAEVGWFERLPPLIAWLDEQSSDTVEMLHE